MPSAPEHAPRPPAPAAAPATAPAAAPAASPAVVAKAQAKAWQVVTKSVAIHPSKPTPVASKPALFVAKKESDDVSAEWEQRVQIRLMELDVDPGNDADQGVSTKSGD